MVVDIKSLYVKDSLNPNIWSKEKKINSDVQKHLITIANDFFNDLDIPWAKLEDITFTGSLANYTWSKYSDIDLHLIVNFELVDENIDLVESYFKARKNIWNNIHDIRIHGFDVEVYVQDAGEPHHSTAVYSLLHDEWLVSPKPIKPVIERESIKRKSKVLMRLIDDISGLLKTNNYKETIKEAEKLSDKIRKMRSCGLEKGGEFSVENLTFKILRRNGFLKKLRDAKLEAYDKMMSIK